MHTLIYTDGSFSSKTNTAGIGIVFPDTPQHNEGKVFTLENPTNQRAELWAIHEALVKASSLKFETLVIFTDSVYSMHSVTKWADAWVLNGWKNSKKKPVLNTDIIKPILELKKQFKSIEFKHVKAHRNNPHNEKADELARCHF